MMGGTRLRLKRIMTLDPKTVRIERHLNQTTTTVSDVISTGDAVILVENFSDEATSFLSDPFGWLSHEPPWRWDDVWRHYKGPVFRTLRR